MTRSTYRIYGSKHNPVRVTTRQDSRGYFRIRWTDPRTGKDRDARRQSLEDAEEFALELSQLLDQDPSTRDLAEATIADLVAHYLDPASHDSEWSRGYEKSMEGLTRRHLLDKLGPQTAARDWTVQDSRRIVNEARGKHTAGVVSNVGVMLRTVATVGLRDGFLTADPMEGVRYTAPQRSKWVDPHLIPDTAAVEALAETFAEELGEWWGGLMVHVAAYCGLRQGEVFGLEGGDVLFGAGELDVRRQACYVEGVLEVKKPKGRGGGKMRRAMFPAFLDQQLRERVAEVEGGLLFPNPNTGTFYIRPVFHRHFQAAREAAGWPRDTDGTFRWSWHSLRHHAATWMLAPVPDGLGQDIADVAAWLGHAKPSITWDMYVSRRPGSSQRAREASRFVQRPGQEPPADGLRAAE